jgi:hypothetical protein
MSADPSVLLMGEEVPSVAQLVIFCPLFFALTIYVSVVGWGVPRCIQGQWFFLFRIVVSFVSLWQLEISILMLLVFFADNQGFAWQVWSWQGSRYTNHRGIESQRYRPPKWSPLANVHLETVRLMRPYSNTGPFFWYYAGWLYWHWCRCCLPWSSTYNRVYDI